MTIQEIEPEIIDFEPETEPTEPADHQPEAETPQPTHKRTLQRLGRFAGKVTLAGAAMLPGAAIGAVGAISEAPPSVKLTPGITAKAQPLIGDYSAIQYGPTVIGFPALNNNIHGVDLGIKLNITELDSKHSDSKKQTLKAVLQDPEGLIEASEVESAMLRRGAEGGLAGAGVALLGLLGASRLLHRRKKQRLDDNNRLARLQEHLGDPGENISADTLAEDQREIEQLTHKLSHPQRLRRKLGGVAAGALLLTGASMAAYREIDSFKPRAGSRTTIFPDNPQSSNSLLLQEAMGADALDKKSVLDGMFITGDIGYFAKESLVEADSQMGDIDKYWSGQAEVVVNGIPAEFLGANRSPDDVLFVQVSDIHDNRSYLKNFLPKVLGKIRPNFVVNTGDEMNYSGKVVLDDGAWQRVASSLPDDTPMVVIAGNHDTENLSSLRNLAIQDSRGKPWRPIIPLSSATNYTTTIDDLQFVGSPDLNRTTDKGTTPKLYAQQMQNDARQGEFLADKACDTYNQTGERPIVLAHEPNATYQSILRNCVDMALSGHLHSTHPLKTYQNSDGSVTLQQTLGTSSGNGPNNFMSIYNRPTVKADMSIWKYNKSTGEFQQLLISIDPHTDKVTFAKFTPDSSQAVKPTEDKDIAKFAQDHQSTLDSAQR